MFHCVNVHFLQISLKDERIFSRNDIRSRKIHPLRFIYKYCEVDRQPIILWHLSRPLSCSRCSWWWTNESPPQLNMAADTVRFFFPFVLLCNPLASLFLFWNAHFSPANQIPMAETKVPPTISQLSCHCFFFLREIARKFALRNNTCC